MTSLLRHPVRVIVSVVILGALVGAGVWLWQGAHSSTPVNEDTVLAEYRAAGDVEATTRPGVPAPGVYRFSQSGKESAGGGPLSVSRPFPDHAVYVVRPIAGGYHEDLRMSGEHVEEVRFRVTDAGTQALWRRTKITFLGIGEDDRNDVTPPSLDHPRKLSVGRTWDGRYTSGEMTVDYRAEVLARESVTLDGKQVPAYVIRTQSEFEGPTSGSRTDTIHFAPSLSLPVRWEIVQSTTGEAEFDMNARLELESAVPQT